jgi:peptidoglycan/xylan/chitin deacetylase (PgdA/CDA1 family)
MMYHHVAETRSVRADTVSPQRFEWHMAYLRNHRFNVLSLDALAQAVRQKKSLPAKSVVITFDDGYEDNYTHAFPILKKYRFPATVFVSSDLMDMPGYLTSGQVEEMMAHGIDIGSHTRTHVYLPDMTGEKQLEEIRGSKERLEEVLGAPVKYFSYPAGGFTEQIKHLVREAGYHGACTTNRGYDRLNRDVFELKRVRFSDKDNRRDYLWMKMTGFYNLFRRSKDPHALSD